jgi:hypothetical protein
VVVLATARYPSPTREATVRLRGPGLDRAVALLGDRRVERHHAAGWRFSAPESFQEMPLRWDRAYGGIDEGAWLEDTASPEDAAQALLTHPGTYPRNDVGRGFRLAGSQAPLEDLLLPNLENTTDLLVPDRLVCEHRTAWHRQPLPAGFGFMMTHWFPRSLYLGGINGPWPDTRFGAVPEAELGSIPAGLLERQATAGPDTLEISAPFFQVSAPGLALPDIRGDERFLLDGVNGSKPLVVDLPGGRPVIRIQAGGETLEPTPRLVQVVMDLDAALLTMLWAAPTPLEHPALAEVPEVDLMTLPVLVDT